MEKYKKSYIIACYECDNRQKIRIRSLFNLLQDISDDHADLIDVGYDFCKKKAIGWVASGYVLDIKRLPEFREKITIVTWPSMRTAATTNRDFQVINENNEILINASSQWVLVQKMRPIPIAKHIQNFDLINERAINAAFEKINIPDLENSSIIFPVHNDEIDLNNHVNNSLYASWAMDGVSAEYLKNHFPKAIQINFKHPAKFGDLVQMKTYQCADETYHLMINLDGTKEFAKLKIIWQATDC